MLGGLKVGGSGVSIVEAPSSERDGRQCPPQRSLMRRDMPDIPHHINQESSGLHTYVLTQTHVKRTHTHTHNKG